MATSVNCYDEFSKLSKIIIGRVDNACTPPTKMNHVIE